MMVAEKCRADCVLGALAASRLGCRVVRRKGFMSEQKMSVTASEGGGDERGIVASSWVVRHPRLAGVFDVLLVAAAVLVIVIGGWWSDVGVSQYMTPPARAAIVKEVP